jgi:hypothetical protein
MCKYVLRKFINGEPFVDQYTKRGINLSWNPDDGRFYISNLISKKTLGSFKDWRNAVQYFKRKVLEV